MIKPFILNLFHHVAPIGLFELDVGLPKTPNHITCSFLPYLEL